MARSSIAPSASIAPLRSVVTTTTTKVVEKSERRTPEQGAAELQARTFEKLCELLPDYVKLHSDGTVNEDATLEKFALDLTEFSAQHARETAGIAEKVTATFDKYVGVKMSVDFFVNQVMNSLNVPPTQWGKTEMKVRAYIDGQSTDGEDGTFSAIIKARGRNGGISRRSDLEAAIES